MTTVVDELGAVGLLDVMTTVVRSEQECVDFAGSFVNVATAEPTLDDGGSFDWLAGALPYLLVASHCSEGFLAGVRTPTRCQES